METTIVQPGSSPSIYTTGDHGRRDHGDNHHFHELRTDADYRALTSQVERFGTLNGDRTLTGVQVTGDRINTVGAATALAAGHTDQLVQAAACRTDSLVQAGFGDTSDRICASTKDVTGSLSTGFTADALANCKIGDQLAESKLATAIGFKDSIIAGNVNAAAASVQAATIGSAAQVLATAFANQAQVTATQNFNLLTGQATENTYKVLLDSQKNASASQLEAEKNHNATMLKLCECCAETQAGFAATQAQAAANLAAITATSVAGTQRILDRMCDDKNADLRAQLVATQRLIPVTIAVGA